MSASLSYFHLWSSFNTDLIMNKLSWKHKKKLFYLFFHFFPVLANSLQCIGNSRKNQLFWNTGKKKFHSLLFPLQFPFLSHHWNIWSRNVYSAYWMHHSSKADSIILQRNRNHKKYWPRNKYEIVINISLWQSFHAPEKKIDWPA